MYSWAICAGWDRLWPSGHHLKSRKEFRPGFIELSETIRGNRFRHFLLKWRHFKYRMKRQWFIIYDSLYMTHELCKMMFRNLILNGLQKDKTFVRSWCVSGWTAGWTADLRSKIMNKLDQGRFRAFFISRLVTVYRTHKS